MTTDTPRTDAFYPSEADFWEEEAKRYCSNSQYWRERAEKAEAEVERLKEGFQGSCYCCEPVGILNQKLEAEVALAQREADSLAQSLNRRFYSEEASNWGLCDSVAGVISQIDNMAAGLGQRAEKAEAEVERLKEQLESTQSLRDSYRTLACSRISEIRDLKSEVAELQQQKRNCIEIIDDDAKEKSELKAEVERLNEYLKIKNNKIKALELSLKTFSNWAVTIKQNVLFDPDFIRITKEVLNEDRENEEKLAILKEKIK